MDAKDRKWSLADLNDENLSDYLEKTIQFADTQLKFYTNKVWKRKLFSNVFLIISVLLFALTLGLTILMGPNDVNPKTNLNYYSISYLALIIASVFLLFDRLFGHSEAWMRYTITKMQLEKVVSEFNGKWIQLIQSMDLKNQTLVNKNELMTTMLLFDKTIRDIVISETETWKGLFSQNIKEFNNVVSESLKESRKNLESNHEEIKKNIEKQNQEEKRKKSRGSLLMNFEKNEKASLLISIEGPNKKEIIELESYKFSKSFVDLEYGLYVINITAIDEKSKKSIERIELIDKEDTKSITVTIK